jgi:putative redox protein
MKPIANASVRSSGPHYRHEIETGHGHRLLADEPETDGGGNAGPAPYELFLSGLGACTAITLRMYAEKKGWDIGELKVELTLLKDREGNTRIERRLHSNASLSDEQWEKLLAISEKTPVTMTVKQGAPIETRRA